MSSSEGPQDSVIWEDPEPLLQSYWGPCPLHFWESWLHAYKTEINYYMERLKFLLSRNTYSYCISLGRQSQVRWWRPNPTISQCIQLTLYVNIIDTCGCNGNASRRNLLKWSLYCFAVNNSHNLFSMAAASAREDTIRQRSKCLCLCQSPCKTSPMTPGCFLWYLTKSQRLPIINTHQCSVLEQEWEKIEPPPTKCEGAKISCGGKNMIYISTPQAQTMCLIGLRQVAKHRAMSVEKIRPHTQNTRGLKVSCNGLELGDHGSWCIVVGMSDRLQSKVNKKIYNI